MSQGIIKKLKWKKEALVDDLKEEERYLEIFGPEDSPGPKEIQAAIARVTAIIKEFDAIAMELTCEHSIDVSDEFRAFKESAHCIIREMRKPCYQRHETPINKHTLSAQTRPRLSQINLPKFSGKVEDSNNVPATNRIAAAFAKFKPQMNNTNRTHLNIKKDDVGETRADEPVFAEKAFAKFCKKLKDDDEETPLPLELVAEVIEPKSAQPLQELTAEAQDNYETKDFRANIAAQIAIIFEDSHVTNSDNTQVVLIPSIDAKMHNVNLKELQVLKGIAMMSDDKNLAGCSGNGMGGKQMKLDGYMIDVTSRLSSGESLSNSTFMSTPSPLGSDSGIEADSTDGNLSWLLNHKINDLSPVPEQQQNITSTMVQPMVHCMNEPIQVIPVDTNLQYHEANEHGELINLPSKTCTTISPHPKKIYMSNTPISNVVKLTHPKKPLFTYTELIQHVLLEKKELSDSGIHQWISDHFAFYKQNDNRWRNLVRYKHSINPHIWKGSFSMDVNRFLLQQPPSKGSGLIAFSPLIDSDGILRVGGRLRKATLLNESQRCPVLPSGHHFTRLLIKQVHERELHAGCQGTLASVRQKYWPIRGSSNVRWVLCRCTTCTRNNPVAVIPQMGLLPEARICPSPPFHRAGIDFAGPMLMKIGNKRSGRTDKVYVCVFVYLTIKAVHLELVSSLSTDAFLAAFDRFAARRGLPSEMWSDHGTNFLGAANKLRNLGNFLLNDEAPITEAAASRGITWKFIPPRAPHHGGLWEPAVKRLKYHLRRVAGIFSLNQEELVTLLAKTEAIANCRPLSALSKDPNDLAALTPGHFLIGTPITATPSSYVSGVVCKRQTRWQLVKKLRQDVWKRRQKECLSEMHSRSKWMRPGSVLTPGQLVIVREDNCSPLQWKLGRIISVRPGRDGEVRGATVKTVGGVYERPAVKLSPLFAEEDPNASPE